MAAPVDFWNGHPVSVSRELLAPRGGGDLTDVVVIEVLGARGTSSSLLTLTLENAAALATLLKAAATR